jgi:hypothetical protein
METPDVATSPSDSLTSKGTEEFERELGHIGGLNNTPPRLVQIYLFSCGIVLPELVGSLLSSCTSLSGLDTSSQFFSH